MITFEATNIILIGPSGAGKSTLGKLLSVKLNLPALELDNLRWAYHDELGYDRDKAAQLRHEQGFVALVDYWGQFAVYALERVLQDYPAGHVISTGAGNVVYTNAEYSARAKKALEPYPYVVLLMPSPDADESIEICKARIVAENPDMADTQGGPLAVNASFIRRPDYHEMATLTIYNGAQTPAETCDAVLRAIRQKP
jgi:shikimate kinase